MQEIELELAVGESVCIGDSVFTVIDIDGEEVSFRVDPLEAAQMQSHTEHAAPPGK